MTPKISINLWKSMPLAKKAIQALSWYHTSPALSASHLRRVQLSFRLQVSTQCPYVQTRDYTQRTRKVQNAGVRNVRSMHQKPDLESRYFDDIAYIRDLDTYGTYQRLRQLAVAGDYPGTSKFVHYLVKHRGEKPNVRIYDALLLSNTDHENGSASEAANLLGEMENEGITPDATTIHAALRVCYSDLRKICHARSLLTGFGSSPRLPASTPSSRRATAKVALFDKRRMALHDYWVT